MQMTDFSYQKMVNNYLTNKIMSFKIKGETLNA